MKFFTGFTFLLISFLSVAELKYCEGTVKELITRNSHEATSIKLTTANGDTSYAQIGDVDGYNAYQEVQISMLMAAYMAGKSVTLELNTEGSYTFTSCNSFEDGIPVRYVSFR